MRSPRTGSSRRPQISRWAGWAALSVGWLLPSAGCQVEYAGMTLPSGKYMHDDVQYFAPGPAFPWANTQAATQRARMQAMGIEPAGAGGPLVAPIPPGMIPPSQNRLGRPSDMQGPLGVEAIPGVPGGGIPAPAPQPGLEPGANLVPTPGNPPTTAFPPGAVPPPGAPPAAGGGEAAVPPGPLGAP